MNKQIEEMRELIGVAKEECRKKCYQKRCTECHLFALRMDCENQFMAEGLFAKGYRKQSDVAREIFAEIEKEIDDAIKNNYEVRRVRIEKRGFDDSFVSLCDGKIAALNGILCFIQYLKNKI